MAAQAEPTWEGMRAAVAALCRKRGWHHGVPIMSATDPTRKVILAKGAPMSEGQERAITFGQEIRVCSTSDVDDCNYVHETNEWTTRPKVIVTGRIGGKVVHEKADLSEMRFHMYIKSLLCQAGAVDWDAELRAMESLFKRINENQRDCYMLGSAFPETSKRSGVTYIFRKGLPTIAMKCTKLPDGSGEKRKFLAALCMHPLGWFAGTHVGCCPPSDEVLAHLLLMRGDEHDFWRRSNQHPIDDPLAAI